MTAASSSTTIQSKGRSGRWLWAARTACSPAARVGPGWAIVASLIETAKLNGVEPYFWLASGLERMVDGCPTNQIEKLILWTRQISRT